MTRAFGDGAYSDEEYDRRLREIDTKMRDALPVSLPSVEEAVSLLDDFPSLWSEALPAERRRLVAPLVDRVYLDLSTKRIVGLIPRPGFSELLAHAVEWSVGSVCVLMRPNDVGKTPNVGMVETGGS